MKRLLAALAVVALLAGMASAAGLTVTHVKHANIAPTAKMAVARVLFDSSYPTGGESLTAAMLFLDHIDYMTITPDTVAAAGYSFGYDIPNAKLFALGLEVTLSTDPAAVTHVVTCLVAADDSVGVRPDQASAGISIIDTVSIDVAATASTITLEEVDSTTDLQYVYVRVIAYEFTN